jgi:hypothetical protein
MSKMNELKAAKERLEHDKMSQAAEIGRLKRIIGLLLQIIVQTKVGVDSYE